MSVGIDQLRIVFTALADAVCAIDKLAAHEGIFSLFQYTADFSALGTVSFDTVVAQLKDLDVAERAELESLVKAKLVMHNKSLEAKLEGGIDLLDEVATFGLEAYAFVQKKLVEGQGIVARAKALVSA